MPSSLVDVPLNGEGVGIDLSGYDLVKTFISSGSDSFDALIEVNTGVGFCTVGRLKGAAVETVRCWGFEFRLRRIDDGVNTTPVQVTVQASASFGVLSGLPGDVVEGGGDVEVPLGDLNEPLTVTCNVAEGTADVLVLGKSLVGDLAPIARLSQGQFINVNQGVNVSSLIFRLLNISDPLQTASCRVWGKSASETDMVSLVAAGRIQLVSGGGGGFVMYQTSRANNQFDGVVTNPGVGLYDVTFVDDLPNNTPIVICNVDPAIGSIPERFTLRVGGDSIAPNAIRLEVLDAAGNHVEPIQITVHVQVSF